MIATLYKYKEVIKSFGFILLGAVSILLIIFVIFLFTRGRKKAADYDNDYKNLCMLKGMRPEEFEIEIADMFSRLGYKAEVVGGSHDGGIDVIARKDGKEYLVQCKKYITRTTGVKDVREFNGVVSARQAEKGFFISTNGFTPEAEKEFEKNPRIELINGWKLVEDYYRASLNKKDKIEKVSVLKCPECGGNLILKKAKQGIYAGKNFYGCSNYPTCKHIENIN